MLLTIAASARQSRLRRLQAGRSLIFGLSPGIVDERGDFLVKGVLMCNLVAERLLEHGQPLLDTDIGEATDTPNCVFPVHISMPSLGDLLYGL